MSEHPVEQAIDQIVIWNGNDDHTAPGAYQPEAFRVGVDGVTRIEACTKSGMYADIPYVRVWKGDIAFAEFCQHQIIGVYFKAEKHQAEDKIDTSHAEEWL